MEYRHAGRSGLVVSVVGLGCNNFGRTDPSRKRIDEAASKAVIDAAFDAGITFFDTADSYDNSEDVLGKYLEGRRDDIVLATKFGNSVQGALGEDFGARGARRYVRRAVERSLRRLRTDWIDLYQFHSPDPLTPVEETLSVLSDLVHEGKIRYIGSSNVAGWQVADAAAVAREAGLEHFATVQNRYNLLDREIEKEILPACRHYGLGVITWRPLADGLLTGKYRRGAPAPDGSRLAFQGLSPSEARFDRLDALQSFASERAVSLLEVAFGGLAAQQPVCSIIAGATSAEQVRSNVAAAAWIPTTEDLAILQTL